VRKIAVFTALAVSLMSSVAFARLEGVDWITLPVDGTEYEVPLYNDTAKNEFYLVYKALHGDDAARAVVLGGKEEKLIYIGDGEQSLWLHMTKDSAWVTEVQ